MKILITGSNGRIGSRLANKLSQKHELVLTSLQGRAIDKIGNTKYYRTDLTNQEEVKNLLDTTRPEIVIHLAGIMGQVCEEDHDLADKINVEATKNLANLSAEFGVKKFIFSSSAAVYPQNHNRPLKEKDANPQNYYGITKFRAEKELEATSKRSDMQVIVLRIFNVYGDTFQQSLISKLITSSKNNETVKIYNPDSFIRDYIHIDDVIRAYELSLAYEPQSNYEVLNIGSGVALSTSDLLNFFGRKGVIPNVNIDKSEGIFTTVVADMSYTSNKMKFTAQIKMEDIISS